MEATPSRNRPGSRLWLALLGGVLIGPAARGPLLGVARAATGGGAQGRGDRDLGGEPRDLGARDGGGSGRDGGGANAALLPLPLPPLPPVQEASLDPGRGARNGDKDAAAHDPRGKRPKPVRGGAFVDVLLEQQNHGQKIARRYAQLLTSGRYDEARQLHEEEGGRRPDFQALRTVAEAHIAAHGSAQSLDQSLVTYTGSELTTFYFTARFADASELPIRVAVDHWGHVAGGAVGPEAVPAPKKRYDRYDAYKTKTVLSLPFRGTFTAGNASPGSGNGHYLNANQRFAIDFSITEETPEGKRTGHRGAGRQNTDYFVWGQDVLAPADASVAQVVDGVPDNAPGSVDVYFRLGNTVVLSLGSGEYAFLCHLMPGSMKVRPGDKVVRGQVLAKVGNSGNSTGPHLHFQLTDGPSISYAGSLPAYFRDVVKNGVRQAEVLPQSGDRLANAEPARAGERPGTELKAATPAPGKAARSTNPETRAETRPDGDAKDAKDPKADPKPEPGPPEAAKAPATRAEPAALREAVLTEAPAREKTAGKSRTEVSPGSGPPLPADRPDGRAPSLPEAAAPELKPDAKSELKLETRTGDAPALPAQSGGGAAIADPPAAPVPVRAPITPAPSKSPARRSGSRRTDRAEPRRSHRQKH